MKLGEAHLLIFRQKKKEFVSVSSEKKYFNCYSQK